MSVEAMVFGEESAPLSPLRHTIYFVAPESRWGSLMGDGPPPAVDAIGHQFTNNVDLIALTYLHLYHAGMPVKLVPRFVPDAINVTAYDLLAIRDFAYDCYVVSMRQDRGRAFLCDQQTVHNTLQVCKATDHFVPVWPQPGLKPRAPERQACVENVAYKGLIYNLDPGFRDAGFANRLAEMGMRLSVGESVGNTPPDWSDFSDADVILAVRNLTCYDATVKPAVKLVNAWLAGAPALVGPEPAYLQLRKSSLDFFEIRTPQNALAALQKLRDDPELYLQMVANGRQRGEQFAAPQLCRRWHEILAGPVSQGFERWRSQSALVRLARPVRFAIRAVRHRLAQRRHLRRVLQGKRILDAASA